MASYNRLTDEIARQLCAVVGAGRFAAGEAVKPDYSHDEMAIYGKAMPEAVCLVESTEEVSEICHGNVEEVRLAATRS